MKPSRLRLDLGRHCIETAIRKRHHRLVGKALQSRASADDLEVELELLKAALEAFDFGRLRARHPALAGGRADVVELEADAAGKPRLRIDGKPVDVKA